MLFRSGALSFDGLFAGAVAVAVAGFGVPVEMVVSVAAGDAGGVVVAAAGVACPSSGGGAATAAPAPGVTAWLPP